MPSTLSRSASVARKPTQTRSTQPVARAFLLYLASERGLADNSLHAYRRDLEDLEEFLAKRPCTLNNAAADDFRSYLQNQTRKGKSTRTVARRLAAIRSFLRFQIGQGKDATPILQQLERP